MSRMEDFRTCTGIAGDETVIVTARGYGKSLAINWFSYNLEEKPMALKCGKQLYQVRIVVDKKGEEPRVAVETEVFAENEAVARQAVLVAMALQKSGAEEKQAALLQIAGNNATADEIVVLVRPFL